MPRHRPEINNYWMCDTGRDMDFFYQNRLEQPLGKDFSPLTWDEALTKASAQFFSKSSPEKTAVFLSSQGSVEEYAAMKTLCEKLGIHKITIKNDLAKQNGALQGDDILISHQKIANYFAASELFALLDVKQVIGEIESGQVETVIYWGHHGGEFSADVLKKNLQLLQISPFADELTEIAELALPTLCHLEKSGTFKNIDGVTSRFAKAVTICPEAKSEKEIFEKMLENMER